MSKLISHGRMMSAAYLVKKILSPMSFTSTADNVQGLVVVFLHSTYE